jgi:hypothetical protein
VEVNVQVEEAFSVQQSAKSLLGVVGAIPCNRPIKNNIRNNNNEANTYLLMMVLIKL